NLLHAVASFAGEIAPVSTADAAIRDQLLAVFKEQPWAPASAIDVAVRNGVVRLSGIITDERQRQALRVAAENIPGVKGVEDNIAWEELVSGAVFAAPHSCLLVSGGRPSGGESARWAVHRCPTAKKAWW